jgi:hypothetical protein
MAHEKEKLLKTEADLVTGNINILVRRYEHQIDEFGEEIQVSENWRAVIKHGDVEALQPYLTETQIAGVQEMWAKITPPEEDNND